MHSFGVFALLLCDKSLYNDAVEDVYTVGTTMVLSIFRAVDYLAS